MYLQTPIDKLYRTSTTTIKKLKLLNIYTYQDLINYFPFRYENYSLISLIANLQEGEVATVKGQITKTKFEITRKGTKIQKFTLKDNTGSLELVWYNQPFLLRLITPQTLLSIAGKVKKYHHQLLIEPEQYELLSSCDQETIHTGRIIPVYPEINGLSSKTIREKIFHVLKNVSTSSLINQELEFLPTQIIRFNHLLDADIAYRNIHYPKNSIMAAKAKEKLAFEELFIIQLSSTLVKKSWNQQMVANRYVENKKNNQLLAKFIKDLPFQLTQAQQRCVDEIVSDLMKAKPMNRFLQGDVGIGKTVVAAIACYLAYLNGFQSLLMAPTEILAFQHYQTISANFRHLPLKIGLQTKSHKISKNQAYDIIIGTHAILNGKLKFNNIGLVIVDEQHRFGVAQRASLKNKGANPHLLTMTATPIPRTTALTLYGELDLSIIDEMPKNRLAIKTYLVPKNKRQAGYVWIKNKIKNQGAQIFIICPLIEESMIETIQSVKAAKKEYEELKNNVFRDFKVGLIHGKLKSKDKDVIMNDFKNKKYDILVSTSVVEVGIDIPNATIMIIEGAERFGLAQLHQLRGRVGRGSKQSYCFLFT